MQSFHISHGSTTVLPTAVILVCDSKNQYQPCRALLDSGSQTSLISESFTQRMRLDRSHARVPTYGLGGTNCQQSRGVVQLKIKSYRDTATVETSALVLRKLTSFLPSQSFNIPDIEFIKNIKLADDNYNKPQSIDIILGADIFFNILLEKQIKLTSGIIAQETIFGYVICGTLINKSHNRIHTYHSSIDVDHLLKKFWEIEELTNTKIHLTSDEKSCEEHYVKNHFRQEDGRYVVRLPFKTETSQLGESKSAAIRPLYMIEKRFENDSKYKQLYTEFMQEYLKLGHMRIVQSNTRVNQNHYFILHHAVLKPSSSTTKLRVVFNASKATSSGNSLNDILYIGPTIQDELVTILLRFRMYKIAFTADIAKMYRQVNMDNKETRFQKIVWRENSVDPIQEYELTTITYGTATAPFLAVRSLKQLVLDEGQQFPHGARILNNDFYVDDLMSGANSIEHSVRYVNQLQQLLSKGGFDIRKWCSNSKELLDHIPADKREIHSVFSINENKAVVKTLGLNWNTEEDFFFFDIQIDNEDIPTKRKILSIVARIYDPLGWLAPFVIKFKILLQKLWISGLSWDEPMEYNIERLTQLQKH